MKASEKQDISKKLITSLKKKFGSATPKQDKPVLETMLFGICLENNDQQTAEELYQRLTSSFLGLNEIRVSSITELVEVIGDEPGSEERALQIRSLLKYVFEETFSFDLEQFTRKTQDQATKFLKKIPHLSSFGRHYVLQIVLGAHIVPADEKIQVVSTWLGFSPVGSTHEKTSEALKSSVRKTDSGLFFNLLRQLSCDDKMMGVIEAQIAAQPEEGFDLTTAAKRLSDLLAGKLKKPVKKAAKKTTTSKVVKKAKKAVKKPNKKVVKKAVKKTTTTKKPVKKATKKTVKKTVKKKVVKKKAKTAKKKSR